MKTLVAYYSRTGTTKKVAKMIAQKLGAELEEIKDTVDRSGVKGYLLSGRDAMKKRLTTLEPATHNVSQYDLVIIGTPIWSWNMSVPARTYVTEQKDNFKDVAYFCTMGGLGSVRVFAGLAEITGKKPKATLAFTTKEVVSGNIESAVSVFTEKLR